MPYKKIPKRRILAIIMPLLLLLAMLPAPAAAKEPDIAYIGIMSDVHGTYENVFGWMENNGNSVEYLVFGGDMDNSWNEGIITVNKLKTYAVEHSVTPIFTMGNHDWWSGSESAFKDATGFNRTGIQNNPAADGFTVYTLGASSSGTDSDFKEEDILALSNALAESDLSSPFFIVSHYPLHSGEGRSGRNVATLIELLNLYPNVFFFWGHNHHHDVNMGTIKTAGDVIIPAGSNNSIPINFTYCNSGHMGYEHGLESGKDGTGVRVEICIGDNETCVNLSILGIFGNILAFEPVSLGQVISVTDITAPIAGAIPDTTGTASGNASIGGLSWFPAVIEHFEYNTAYTVSFDLTDDSGVPFTSSTIVTVNGMPAYCVLNGDGTVTVSYTFPKTMPDPRNSITFFKTSTISHGKEYAIVFDGVAMNNITATDSTSHYDYEGLSYTQPLIDGEYLTIYSPEEADKATWTFLSTGKENEWYIQNGGLYLYASKPRTLALSGIPQAWTYGEMGDKGIQLHINLEGEDCNLNYGGDTVVDMVYPSVNNQSTLAIYEKVEYTENSVSGVNLEITAPSAGSPPDRTAHVTGGEATAGIVSWSPEVIEAFEYSTAYTVSVKLTAYDGYIFNGATKVKFNGIDATGKQLNSDGTLTAYFDFPETAPDPSRIVTFVRTDAIVHGHKYAIVLDNLAMNNIAASNSSYTGLFYTIPMTIDDDYLTIYSQDEAEKATWTFLSAGEENQWHIKNGDNYLYAPESGKLTLSDTEQVWTYGQLDDKGTQLYTDIGKPYNLCYGKDRADLIYPSSNNSSVLKIYEKVIITEDTIGTVVLELDEPSAGCAPAVTAVVIEGEATVTGLTWSPQVADIFDYDTAYTVNIELSANNDYRLSVATVVTVNGNISKNTLNSDGTLTAAIEFPPTASDPAITVKYKRTEGIASGLEYAITFDGCAMNTIEVSESSGERQYNGLSFFTPEIDGEYLIFSSGAEARDATWTFTNAEEEGKWYISIGDKYLYAPEGRTLKLGAEPQAWTYGESDDDEKHLSVNLNGQEYTLYNKDDIDGPIYPSSGNRGSFVLYEKNVTHNEAIFNVSVSGISVPSAGSAPDMDAVISPDGAILESVSWSPAVKDCFAHNTVYTACITLTAQSGYYFTEETAVKVNDESASNVTLGKDGSLTAQYIFPKTEPDPSQTLIDNADITIIAPEAGSPPDTKVIVSQGVVMAGIVSWSPHVSEAFAYDTVYTATVTLTTETGYYLTDETHITVNGKTPSKITLDSGDSLTVEYVFSKTAPDPSLPSIDTVALNITAPKAGSTPDTKAFVSQGEATSGTVVWSPVVRNAFRYNTVYSATVTLTANNGYCFTEKTTVTVNGYAAGTTLNSDGTLSASYAFAPTISEKSYYPAVFPAPTRKYFWDVPKDAWYYDAVQYVARKGIIEGITLTSFEPNSPMIRALFVQISYTIEGYRENTGKPEFHDVNTDMWYCDAIAWAAAKGIIKGYSPELFGPEDYITREQFITILYRYAKYKGYSDDEYTKVTLPFTDTSEISDYALPAIKWAYYELLIVSEAEGPIRPGAVATRAEIADVLMRYHEAFIAS